MAVFVLDHNGKALMPCTEKRAKLLLTCHRARIHRVMPFVIRLTDRQASACAFQPLRIKLDPGSKTTGIALVRETIHNGIAIVNLFELIHRGRQISEALTARRSMRRARRGRNTRYRAARFNNRTKPAGWLAPSLQHRVDTTMAWVRRISKLAPITAISQELVRFDMQAMESPNIEGIEYQQGTLFGYEVREYLLEKFNRTCAYCDAKNTPLQIEHIHAKANNGSNRISNLTIACGPCNQRKGAQDINAFLTKDPARLAKILAQAKKPLKDAAAVNSTRWALFNALASAKLSPGKATRLPVEVASGGRTKYNRMRLNIPKTHALDAACVGVVDSITGWNKPTLQLKAMGRGCYQRARLNKYGFARGHCTRSKSAYGFQTGDMVKAAVLKGQRIGNYVGRVQIRANGNFNIQGIVTDIPYKCCELLQRNDGYGYLLTKMIAVKQGERTGSALHCVLSRPGINAEVPRTL